MTQLSGIYVRLVAKYLQRNNYSCVRWKTKEIELRADGGGRRKHEMKNNFADESPSFFSLSPLSFVPFFTFVARRSVRSPRAALTCSFSLPFRARLVGMKRL